MDEPKRSLQDGETYFILRKTQVTEQPFRKLKDGTWESFGIKKEHISHSLLPRVKGKSLEPTAFETPKVEEVLF